MVNVKLYAQQVIMHKMGYVLSVQDNVQHALQAPIVQFAQI